MFHSSAVGAFRPYQVYEGDFPSEDAPAPYHFLGLEPYSVKKLVNKLNATSKSVPQREVVTFEEKIRQEGDLIEGGRQEGLLQWYLHAGQYDDGSEVGFIDRALVHRGLQYYFYETTHEKSVASVAPNLRDLGAFANIPGFAPGQIFRSAYLLSSDPAKLVHVLQHVLQIRSIIDLRGFVPLRSDMGDTAEAVTRQAILSLYRPFIFDGKLRRWLCLGDSYADINLNNVRAKSMRTLTFMPAPAEELELSCTQCSLYCFNMGLPPPGIPDELQRVFQPVTGILRKLASHIEKFWSSESQSPTNVAPPENFITRLLVAGSLFFKMVLDTLLWVQTPVLICATHGKDRVGVISMLLLYILGASEEAILTDYCASEAGLCKFQGGRPIAMVNNYRKFGTSRPSSGRAILRFIRDRWGSIQGYLDAIGFDHDRRERLRRRFVYSTLPDKLMYKLPASAPFWTQNPAVLIPPKQRYSAPPANNFRGNASAIRVLRVATLLRLRDAFDYEASPVTRDGGCGVYVTACYRLADAWRKYRRFCKACKVVRCLARVSAPRRVRFPRSIATSCSVWGRWRTHVRSVGAIRVKTLPMRHRTWKATGRKGTHWAQSDPVICQRQKLRKDLCCLELGLKEFLLARKIVLQKLTEALMGLRRADVVRFLMYRNTQVYAERNQGLRVGKAPDLHELYLNHPDLFARRRVRTPQDTVNIILDYIRSYSSSTLKEKWSSQEKESRFFHGFGSITLSFFPLAHPRLDTPKERGTSESLPARYKPSPSPSLKKTAYKYVDPLFFFHELCSETFVKHLLKKKGENRSSTTDVLPQTFGQWLLHFWMVPTDAVPMKDPFEDTRDEWFVPPDVLAKYMRLQARIRKTQEPLLSREGLAELSSSLPYSTEEKGCPGYLSGLSSFKASADDPDVIGHRTGARARHTFRGMGGSDAESSCPREAGMRFRTVEGGRLGSLVRSRSSEEQMHDPQTSEKRFFEKLRQHVCMQLVHATSYGSSWDDATGRNNKNIQRGSFCHTRAQRRYLPLKPIAYHHFSCRLLPANVELPGLQQLGQRQSCFPLGCKTPDHATHVWQPPREEEWVTPFDRVIQQLCPDEKHKTVKFKKVRQRHEPPRALVGPKYCSSRLWRGYMVQGYRMIPSFLTQRALSGQLSHSLHPPRKERRYVQNTAARSSLLGTTGSIPVFNTDDERDWVLRQALDDRQMRGWLMQAEEELQDIELRRGQKLAAVDAFGPW